MNLEGKNKDIFESIAKETLRLMFVTDDASGRYTDIAGVNDYKDKMNGAVYRAIIRVCQAKKAGYKTINIENDNIYSLNDGLDLTIADSSAKIMQIDKVSVKYKNCSTIPYNKFYTIDYKTLVLDERLPEGTKVKVYYYPSYVELEELRDDVISIIPYFVKSELYEEDEAGLAAKARNMFEQQLLAIEMNPQTVQTQIENVFRGM